jgi:hypothetical protein
MKAALSKMGRTNGVMHVIQPGISKDTSYDFSTAYEVVQDSLLANVRTDHPSHWPPRRSDSLGAFERRYPTLQD